MAKKQGYKIGDIIYCTMYDEMLQEKKKIKELGFKVERISGMDFRLIITDRIQ